MKKLIVIATSLAIIGMASPVFGVTVEELQAQIAALLAQITTLQAQLTALGGGTGTVPPACAGITSFATNLSQGSSGADVKCLQAILNQSAATQVAATGIGSAGNETTYFGSLTKAAVVKYQTANTISPAVGYVGPITRAKLNTVLILPPPVACSATVPCPAGKICQAGVCVTAPVGGEGTYTVALSAAPVGATVNAGNDISVYGIDVRAYNSDITIARVDLQAAVTVSSVTYSPATLITAVSIYDGATLLKKTENPVFTKDTSNLYYTQIIGFNFLVPNGTKKTLTVKVDTATAFDTDRSLVVNVYGSGIRGVDGAGLSTYAALATTRTFTIQKLGAATLTASANTNNPISNNIQIDPTSGVENVPLLIFNAKATIGNATLTTLGVYASGSTGYAVPSALTLYDGDTLIASATPVVTTTATNYSFSFTDFELAVAKDVTKTLTLKGTFAELGSTLTNNNVLLGIPVTSALSTYDKGDGSTANTTIASAIASNRQFLYEEGVKFTFISGTNTVATSTEGQGSATGELKFKVEPFGGTLTKFTEANEGIPIAGVTVRAYISDAATTYATGASRVIAVDPNTDTSDGGSATVTVTMVATDDGSTNVGLMRFEIDGISWTVGSTSGAQYSAATAGNMFDNWITPFKDLR